MPGIFMSATRHAVLALVSDARKLSASLNTAVAKPAALSRLRVARR
jgi:hypothetical protein